MKKADVPQLIRNQVKDIFIYRNPSNSQTHSLPFYADGHPGIVYLEAESATIELPEKKRLSPIFMYGQTVHPVTIHIKGSYLMIIFRLEPLASHYILNADSELINNDCLDLTLHRCSANSGLPDKLKPLDADQKTESMARFIQCLTMQHGRSQYDEVQKAVQLILRNKGKSPVSEIRKNLFLSERTFQRKFRQVVGLTPKQFSTIVRFHVAKSRLTDTESSRFGDIVHHLGFSDQSHFIKVFKHYTGKTPVDYLNHISAGTHQPLN
jgi:AraC-like DNA-binding protein